MGRRVILSALAAGAGAGLALTAMMLALRLVLDAPAFPERITDKLLLLIPQALFSASLDRFGFAAKPLLFIAIIAAQVAALSLIGLVYAALAVLLAGRIDLTSPFVGGAFGLLLGSVGDALILPTLGIPSSLLTTRASGLGPTLAQLALPGLAYGVALVTLLRLASPPRPSRDPRTGTFVVARQQIARRNALALLLTLLGGLITAGTLRRLLGPTDPPNTSVVAPPPPPPSSQSAAPPIAQAETPAPVAAAPTPTTGVPTPQSAAQIGGALSPVGTITPASTPISAPPPAPTASLAPAVVSPPLATPTAVGPTIPPGVAAAITPTEQFYIISKNLIDPTLGGENWRLMIGGLVGRPQTLRHADLLALPATDLTATLECISNEPGGALIGNARWTGVPLQRLLASAAIRPEATHVVFTCADDYVERLTLAQALDPATLLVHTMNGAPLTAKHGFPARLLAAGRYGMKHPKWLVGIELVGQTVPSYWSQRGWDPDAPVQVFTRIDVPAPLATRGPLAIGGVAFAGDRGISRVELSTDGGATWQTTRLEPALSALSWVRWVAPWEPPGPGTYTLVARAYEADGTPQAAETRTLNARGSTGYGRRVVTITS